MVDLYKRLVSLIHTIKKKYYQIDDDHRHFSEKWDDEDEILGI